MLSSNTQDVEMRDVEDEADDEEDVAAALDPEEGTLNRCYQS
jgi:hypothetical protein